MKRKIMTGSLAAVLFVAALPMTALAARGEWVQQNGTWKYQYSDGTFASDEWKQSGNDWFYLDGNGEMAANSLIETDDDYYYVNGGGARVTDEWCQAVDDDGEIRWYYFGSNGKARKSSSSGKVSTVEINGKRYAFDSEGRMLYGWVKADSPELMDEDDENAWADADYYFGEPEDGVAAIGWT